VTAGQTTPLDAQLVKGGVLAGTVTNGSSVVDLGYVWSYNARTGDMASASFANIRHDGTFELRGHPSQSVYVSYRSETSGCWYGTAPEWVPRPARARPVTVTAGATTTITMDIGRTCAPPPRI
jgi:hypothetical protein